MNIVIMAGGGGTRLWPWSRNHEPKQFSRMIGEQSLLQQTFARFNGDFSPQTLYVATREEYADRVQKDLPELLCDHLLVEPEKRDTAPAMGFVCAKLFSIAPDEPVAFIPSDHLIQETDLFLRSLQVADKLIRETGKMVDIGVVPTWANTNLGYTKVGKTLREIDGIRVVEFLGHTEKPPREKAEKYLRDGNYLWHASYYMWTPRKFLQAFEKYQPEMYQHLAVIAGGEKDPQKIFEHFQACEKISFDYAVTELMDPHDVLILPAAFEWSDIGTWSVVKDDLQENPQSNVTKGETLSLDTNNCLLYGKKGKMIATVGLQDMIVVDTDDALLICPKDRDQDVKKIVEMLKERGDEHYC